MAAKQIVNYMYTDNANFLLDCFDEKEELMEVLSKSTPTPTIKISTKDTSCDFEFWHYNLCFNNVDIEINEVIGNVLYEVLTFVEQVICVNEPLVCGLDSESIFSLLVTIPVDKEKLRFTYYYEWTRRKWQEDSGIKLDIIVDKKILINAFLEILNYLQVKVFEYPHISPYNLGHINEFRELFGKYLKNPDKFLKTHNFKWKERVFDVAYKNLDNIWQFVLCFEDDERSNIKYWQNLKKNKKIIDFHFLEQYPESLYLYDKKYYRKRIPREKLKLKTDFAKREEEYNWVYSNETKCWYSSNEIMPEITKKCKIFNRLSIGIDVYSYYSRNKKEQIADFASGNYDSLYCFIKLDDIIGYLIQFDYQEKDRILQNLDKVEKGENVRFSLGCLSRMNIWNSKDNFVKVLIHNYSYKKSNKDGGKYFLFKMKKDMFLNYFRNGIEDIENEIQKVKDEINKSEADSKCYQVK